MSYTIFENPDIGNNPIMFAVWPGIGDAELQAGDFLVKALNAKPFAEINSSEYYYPISTIIEDNVIKGMKFPRNTFYSKKYSENKNFIFFLSDQQPPINEDISAEQNISYKMANEILDLAEKFGCKRIYTAGATFALIHHSMNSDIMYGTDNHFFTAELASILGYKFKMADKLMTNDFIGGMNGILPLAAIDRNMEVGVLLGKVPIYLQTIQIPYPKAAKTIIEAFVKIHKIDIDLTPIDNEIEKLNKKINDVMGKFSMSIPTEIRKSIFSEINKLKEINKQAKKENSKTTTGTKNLTIKDVKNAINEIEQFFKKENSDDL